MNSLKAAWVGGTLVAGLAVAAGTAWYAWRSWGVSEIARDGEVYLRHEPALIQALGEPVHIDRSLFDWSPEQDAGLFRYALTGARDVADVDVYFLRRNGAWLAVGATARLEDGKRTLKLGILSWERPNE